MKLTEEHIGRTIKGRSDTAEVLAVHNGWAWVFVNNIRHDTWFQEHPDYSLIEQIKKPSERIGEIVRESDSQLQDTPLKVLNAVLQYLDEQAEKK